MTGLSSAERSEVRLVLPSVMEVVPGVPVALHLPSAVLDEHLNKAYRFEVDCEVGEADDATRWILDVNEDHIGEYPMKVQLKDDSLSLVDQALIQVRVIPRDAGERQELTLLLVGDSLTHLSLYPNEVARLLSEPGNPSWRMLGMHRPGNAAEGVAHEGYGGWTWERFNTHFNHNLPPGSNTGSSPFLFVDGQDGKAALDVERYLRENGSGREPDMVVFFLGINDCFHLPPNDRKAIEVGIDRVFLQAEILLGAFRKALPDTRLGICLTPEPNAREGAFIANYGERYTREGWRRIQYRFVERQLDHFGGREEDNIFVIPTSMVVDPVDGYPSGNAVHPSREGFRSIAASVYAWIKSGLAEDKPMGFVSNRRKK